MTVEIEDNHTTLPYNMIDAIRENCGIYDIKSIDISIKYDNVNTPKLITRLLGYGMNFSMTRTGDILTLEMEGF